jgi:hypothetical protein
MNAPFKPAHLSTVRPKLRRMFCVERAVERERRAVERERRAVEIDIESPVSVAMTGRPES